MQFQIIISQLWQFLLGAVNTMGDLVLGALMGAPHKITVRIAWQPVCAFVPAPWMQSLGVWENAQY